ncbi:MAG TPA: Si-specific NAD(P)(+) transhydrogenase [Candidatus Binatia bacterium]|nr:Si-specific NAD(P)(+) transhydrogenase [Candidatus Binatia bacterium]
MPPSSDSFDLVVIGAGPAGEKAAAHAAYFGRRVAVVERSDRLGGVVVNSGGVPTKTLRETALFVTGFRKRDIYGVSLQLDRSRALAVLHERTDRVMAEMEGHVRQNLHRHGVEVIHGRAHLAGSGHVAVSTDGSERLLEAPAVVVATGSRPVHPPGIPFDDLAVFDSDELLAGVGDMESMVVIGGGAIGCEYASILTALGVGVTLVNAAPTLLPVLDSEMSSLLCETFQSMGMRLCLGTRVAGVERDGAHIVVTLSGGERIGADRLLVAVGRAGNTEGLGLEEAGVELTDHGLIRVDAKQRTTAPGIYAAGDVTGPPALASAAAEEGRRAASSALRTPLHEAESYRSPVGVYTVPEVAGYGLTESEAVAQGIDHIVGRARFADNSRANIAGSTEGMVKLVCGRDGRLLGVHILGDIAAELVHIGQALVEHGGRVDYLLHATFNVPTWSDAYGYAAFDALRQLEGSTPPWLQAGSEAG